MLLKVLSFFVFLSILPFLTLARPLDAVSLIDAASSGHNIYLVSCVPRNKTSDSDPKTTNFTAIAYFKQPLGATNSTSDPSDGDDDGGKNKAPKPDKGAVVSDPASPWEGVKWRVTVWRDKVFQGDINDGAQTLDKGAIAGSVKLGDDDYACFRDGTTAIRYREDDRKGNCVADYWCAELTVASGS